jgi:hypothetical protein
MGCSRVVPGARQRPNALRSLGGSKVLQDGLVSRGPKYHPRGSTAPDKRKCPAPTTHAKRRRKIKHHRPNSLSLGGGAEGALKSKALAEWSFELSLDLGPERVIVRRGAANSRVFIRKVGGAPSDVTEVTNAAWGSRLGQTWFNLNSSRQVGAASFRQLISYFARRRRDGGYDDPVRTFRTQTNAVSETNLAVLFGLDAEVVRRFHNAKNALKQIQGAQKALRDLEKSSPAGARRIDLEAALSAQVAAATLARDQLKVRIDSFNVLPVFRELEHELASLNERGRDLSDEDVLDRESLQFLRI